jgi:L-methionine (R)-S-oxide reductase
MSETLIIDKSASKAQMYEALLPQLSALVAGEINTVANLANIAAALRETFNWWWVGFYLVEGDELVLGPFQGPIACTRIKFGRGVCGSAWKQQEILYVPDVEKFPGHIACSSLSVAEIVVPLYNKSKQVVAVLDIDSERYDVLDEVDVRYLSALAEQLACIW